MRLLQGWVTTIGVHTGCCVSLHPKRREQHWKHVNNYSFTMKVRVMIICTVFSQGWDLGVSLWPGIEKPHTWISSPRFFQKQKIQDSTFWWKMHAHSFLGLQMHHSAGVHDQRQENQLYELRENPKVVVTSNESRSLGQKKKNNPCFLNMIQPYSTLVLPLQWWEHQIWSCYTPSVLSSFGTLWLEVSYSSQETFQSNSWNMWWRNSRCYG
jgi:hypothetical protein